MRPETEIRRRRDELREVLNIPIQVENDEAQAGLFLMKSHEVLLSWVLGENECVEKPFQGVSQGLQSWRNRN